MRDYIRTFSDEAAAIAACPELGHEMADGGWCWSTVSVIAGVILTTSGGDVVPGFALWIARPEVDEDLAAVADLELSRDLGPQAVTLAECITRSAPGFLAAHPVVSISPVMMGSNYPIEG